MFYQILLKNKLQKTNQHLTWYQNLFATFLDAVQNILNLTNQMFTYRKVPVHYDGTCTIDTIKGNTVKFNQLVQNGNFADTNGWQYGSDMTISASNNELTVNFGSRAYANIARETNLILNHKYYISCDVKSNYSNELAIGITDNTNFLYTKVFNPTTNYLKYSEIINISSSSINDNGTSVFLRRNNQTVTDTVNVKNFMLMDLTLMGIGNLTTTTEAENWLSSHLGNLPYFNFTLGSLISFNGTGLKSRNLSEPKSTTIYGIKRELSSSSSTWTRTDGGVDKTANATHDGSSATNDFDFIYPWSEIKTVNLANDGTVNAILGDSSFKWDGSNGEVMTYIPSFWYKRWQDSTYEYMQISQSEFSGASYSKGFYIGRYTTSSGTHSKSGVSSQVSTTITNFRTQATAKGTGWQQMDYHYFLLQLLYLVEYADGNSQSKLGQGVCSVSAQVNSGALDSLGMKSGCLANAGATSVIYRGIENIFGNIWQFVDGLNIKDNVAYICYKPSSYQVNKFDGDYSAVGYTNANSNGNPNKMGYDSNNPMVALPVVIGTSVYGDYYWQDTGNIIAFVGGNWNHGADDGLFCWALYSGSGNANAAFGSRLIYNEENPLLENYSTLSLPISTYFPTGMKSAGSVYDELSESKATTRIGSVDLGSLECTYTAVGITYPRFRITMPSNYHKPTTYSERFNLMCPLYTTGISPTADTGVDMQMTGYTNDEHIYINNFSYTSVEAFKQAMSDQNVKIYYELATPTETDISPALDLTYPVENGGTEQILPENTATPTTTGILCDMTYRKGHYWEQTIALSILMGREVITDNPEEPLNILMRGE